MAVPFVGPHSVQEVGRAKVHPHRIYFRMRRVRLSGGYGCSAYKLFSNKYDQLAKRVTVSFWSRSQVSAVVPEINVTSTRCLSWHLLLPVVVGL